jgi:DNA ligase 1
MTERTFRPMLAERNTTWEDFGKIFAAGGKLLASPKLDGIRCIIRDGIPVSRTLKPIPNRHIQQTLSGPYLEGFDGELIVGDPMGPEVYKRTSSGVMSQAGTPDFTFWIFDYALPDSKEVPYISRLGSVRNLIPCSPLQPSCLKVLGHTSITTLRDLEGLEEDYVELGYEGLILRHPDAPYKWGRSTLREQYMLKLKRYEDSEAKIIGFEPLYHNENAPEIDNLGLSKRSTRIAQKVRSDQLGAFKVQDIHNPNWVFSVGTGFNSSERYSFWAMQEGLLGGIIKYKYMPCGTDQLPRHPVYRGFRHENDISA